MTEVVSRTIDYMKENEMANLYIATPQSNLAYFDDAFKNIPNHNKILKGNDLDKYVRRKLNCESELIESEIHDLISQTEQEIALRSNIFLSSIGSSWSTVVNYERIAWETESKSDTTNLKALGYPSP